MLDPDDPVCPSCGTETGPRDEIVVRVRRCPRCGYRGEGVGYFRRPSHVAILVAAALFTYGLGGVVYWLVRHRHRVCPRCGLGWEHAHRRTRPAGREEEGDARVDDGLSLPAGGGARRVMGVLGILVAALLISLGIVELNLILPAVGGVVGLAGAASFWWGWRGLQERREALLAELQRRMLHLATGSGGTLTVTEAAAALDLSLEAAERVLISMDDGFRVRSEITPEGLLLYEFPEIQHRARLEGE